jgi:hypothetical protein
MGRTIAALLGSAVQIEEAPQILLEEARRPKRIAIMVDPQTQDRILVYYFDDRPPAVIRMTIPEILRARRELLRLEARFRN